MLRSVLFSLLAPAAVAQCLGNGTHPSLRKNLVNPETGESYPLGITVPAWAASYATSYMAGILIQDLLGINVTYSIVTGQVEAFFSVAGCLTPNNSSDRGCGPEGPSVTYQHLQMETWYGNYPAVWAQTQTFATPPKLLGSMGYEGTEDMYFSSRELNAAYEAEGLALDYWTGFDATWKQPGLYFDQPSAVNRSMLKPCADTNLYNDLMMSAYLSASGDTDGVVVQPDGKVVGKCPGDGYFWLSPSCRSDPTKCVLYITGGGGYGLSGVLQRATRWNIPLAFGVGATWGDFVSVANTKKSMFYWYKPTFWSNLSLRAMSEGRVPRSDWSANVQAMRCGLLPGRRKRPHLQKCPDNSRTLQRGSLSFTDCGCEVGYINVANVTVGNLSCTECQEGLTCPVMGTLASLKNGAHPLGTNYLPAVAKGYFVTELKPLEVYRCGHISSCPGGLPAQCNSGLIGVPCGECPEGFNMSDGKCEQCDDSLVVLWALGTVFVFLFLTASYYLMTSKVTAKASVLFTTTCAFGMLISLLQSIGIIGTMTVEFPVNISSFFGWFSILLLDLDNFGFACLAGSATALRYSASVLFFPAGIAWYMLNYGVSQLVPKHRWDATKVASCMGQFLQVGFSTMSATALIPLTCYTHPNNQQSLLKYPNVICGTDVHGAMLAIGVALLIVGVFGFLSLCSYAAYMVPTWSAREQHGRVRAFRFYGTMAWAAWLRTASPLPHVVPRPGRLRVRFCTRAGANVCLGFVSPSSWTGPDLGTAKGRLDSWWFGVPLLTRGPLIALPIVLATDYPAVQTVWVTFILLCFLACQALAWPWKVPLLNALDCWMSYCIMILVAASALYLEPINKQGVVADFVDNFNTGIMVVIFSSISSMIIMAVCALFHRAAMGGNSEYAVFNLGRTPNPDVLAQKMKEMAELLGQMETKEVEKAFDALAVFDTRRIMNFMTMMSAEVLTGRSDLAYGTRVSSASFQAKAKATQEEVKPAEGGATATV